MNQGEIMRKPELKDFALTEELLDLNKEQYEKYNRQLEEYCKSVKKVKIAIIVISLIITFIVFIVNCANGFESKNAGIALGIVGFWDATVVFSCFQSLDISIWDIRESKRNEIKIQTMNISLNTAVENYNKAVSEYKYYLKKCTLDFWKSLNGFQFEKEVAALYRKCGYDTTVTSATGDGGVDIILIKDGERIAVQCKHHAKAIGPHDIRALQGVVASSNYTKGIFVSLNGYTTSAREEAKMSRVKVSLLDLNDILEMAKDDDMIIGGESDPLPPKPQPKPQLKPEPDETISDLYNNLVNEDLLVGKKIIHKNNKLGVGEIVKIENHINGKKYIHIYFRDILEEKIFPFPNVFAEKTIEPYDYIITRKDKNI